MYRTRMMNKIASNQNTCRTVKTGVSNGAAKKLTLAMMLTPTDNAALEE
jgi:hypothetical protein